MPRYNKSTNPSAIIDLTGWLGGGARTRLTGLSGTPRTTGGSVAMGTGSFSASIGCAVGAAAAGQTWTAVGWVRSSVARTIRVGLVTWNGSTFVAAGGAGGTDTALTANQWTEIRVSGTLGSATFDGVNFHCDLPGTGTAGTLSLSSCRLEQVTDAALAYADGDSGSGWEWDGTSGASTSTQPDNTPVVVTDLVPAAVVVSSPVDESVEALTNVVDLVDPLPAQVQLGADEGAAGSVDVTLPDLTPAAVEAGQPTGETVAVSVTDPSVGQISASSPGGETVVVAEPGLPAGGSPHVTLWLVDRVTGALSPLPHPLKVNLSPQRNAPGAFSFDYPAFGARFETLRSEILDQRRRVLVEMWVGGSRFNAMRGYVVQASGDDVAEQSVWSFGGHFLEWRMTDARVARDTADSKGEVRFAAATVGTIVRTLMLQAQARGTLTGLTYATLTNTLDSAGIAWSNTVTIKFTPYKTTYLTVLDRLVALGLCEWEITVNNELKIWNAGGRGRDLTTYSPPVRLRIASSLTESQRRVDLRDVGTDLYGTGGEGLYASAVDATARARIGAQIERDIDSSNFDNQGALTAFVQASLPIITEPIIELTHGLVFGSNRPAPVSGFRVGDWLYSDVGRGLERIRVVQWVLSEDVGGVAGSVTLNDTIGDRVTRLQRRLDALSDGSATIGTSTPTGPDTMAPAAPTGVTADSLAYSDGAGGTLATLIVGWAQVTTNADATAADDVAGYRVEWRQPASTGWELGSDRAGATSTSASFGGVSAGATVQVRVAAYDYNGNTSAWSAVVQIVTNTDDTAPPTPSTPIVTPYLGQLKIRWDGLGSVGQAMPADLDYVEVHLSTTNNFTPTAGTRIDQFSTISGERVATALAYATTYYVRLVAVDRTTPTPNKSAPSAVGSSIPEKVVQIDIGPNAIGQAQIIDLEVITAKLDNLAANDAKVANMSAGKITAGTMSASVILSGIFRTATSGQRMEIDSNGWRSYKTNGTTKFAELDLANEVMLMTGTYQSGLSGERIHLLTDGTARYYQGSGANFSEISNEGATGLRFRGPAASNSTNVGYLYIAADNATIAWGAQTLPSGATSRLRADSAGVQMFGKIVGFRQLNAQSAGGTIFMATQNSSFVDIAASVLNHVYENGAPVWSAPAQDVGLIFGSSQVFVGDGAGTAGVARSIVASAFTPASARARKTAETPVATGLGLPARDVVRAVRIKQYKFLDEVATRPARPGFKVRAEIRDARGQIIGEDWQDAEWAAPKPKARVHTGPMADDLFAVHPSLVANPDDPPEDRRIDLLTIAAMAWEASGEAHDELDALIARVTALEGRSPINPIRER